jgi:hypothetical protein
MVRMIMATKRKLSGSKWNIETRYDRVRVKAVKLARIPNVIPNGFSLPPVDVADRTIGRSGQMHGAKIVNSPEIKANSSSIGIIPAGFC